MMPEGFKQITEKEKKELVLQARKKLEELKENIIAIGDSDYCILGINYSLEFLKDIPESFWGKYQKEEDGT